MATSIETNRIIRVKVCPAGCQYANQHAGRGRGCWGRGGAVVVMLKVFLRGKSKTPASSSQSLFLADDPQTNPLAGTLEQSDTHTGRGEPHYFKRDDSLWGFFRGDEEKTKKKGKKKVHSPHQRGSVMTHREQISPVCDFNLPSKMRTSQRDVECAKESSIYSVCIQHDPSRGGNR